MEAFDAFFNKVSRSSKFLTQTQFSQLMRQNEIKLLNGTF